MPAMHQNLRTSEACFAIILAVALAASGAQAAGGDAGPVQVALTTAEADVLESSGGKGSKELQDLLAWAIEHSDPEELRRQAAEEGQQDAASFAERKARVQQLMEQMKQEPSEQELMHEALAVARNTSESLEQREAALTALRYLVEPIDNANYLPGMGGLPILLDLMQQPSQPALQAAAQYVLGTAASNNAQFQAHVLEQTPAVRVLLQNARSEDEAVADKALYALGSLIRNNHEGHLQFYAAGGVPLLKQRLAQAPSQAQLRKLLNLVTDLTDVHGEVEGQEAFADTELVKSLLALLAHPDFDIRERAVLGAISLAASPPSAAKVRAAGGRQAVERAEAEGKERLRDADADHAETLEHFLVLLGDLSDLLVEPAADRTEL